MPSTRIRLGAAALALAAVMFVLYPVVRPWQDESVAQGAIDSFSSGAWVASHVFAMIGFILVPLGLLAVRTVVSPTPAEPIAATAAVTSWIGAGLTLPYYGAETFALNVIGQKAAEGHELDVLDLAESIRFAPVAAVTFALGLMALGLGAVLAAQAIRKSGVLPRWSGVLFAAGFALFIPQFFFPPAGRIAHGVLLGVGLAWMAVELWRARTPVSVSD